MSHIEEKSPVTHDSNGDKYTLTKNGRSGTDSTNTIKVNIKAAVDSQKGQALPDVKTDFEAVINRGTMAAHSHFIPKSQVHVHAHLAGVANANVDEHSCVLCIRIVFIVIFVPS